MRSGLKIIVFFSLILFSDGMFLYAKDMTPDSKKNDFLIKKWTTENGLPQNTVTSIIQTRNGYLWLGTFGGLARFDGVKFTVFDSASVPVMKSNRILSLFEDEWDRLWIGTELGEVYIKDKDGFHLFSTESAIDRVTVTAIVADDTNHIFLSSDTGIERYTLDNAGEVTPGSGIVLTNERTFGLYKHPNGSVWARVQGNVFKIEDIRLTPLDPAEYPITHDILSLDFAPDGSMLYGGGDQLGVASKAGLRKLLSLDPDVRSTGFAIKSNGDSYWLLQANRLFEFKGAETVRHDLNKYIGSSSRSIFFDREGNLWLGMNGDGLIRLTRRKVDSLSEIQGFDHTSNFAMAEDGDGAVWIAGRALQRLKDGKVTKFKSLKGGGNFPVLRTLAFDVDGRLWVAGTSGIFYFESGQLIPKFEFVDSEIFCLYFDNDGILWAGGRDGVWRFSGEDSTHFNIENGLPNNSVHYIMQTRDGTIWIGTVGGVCSYRNGLFSALTSENGLSGNDVRAIHEEEDGSIWLGTYGGGLSRIRDGKIVSITAKDGLYDNFVSRILADDEDRLWILGNLGVFAVRREELTEVADGTRSVLTCVVFDSSDGIRSSEANGGHQPAGIKKKDGELLFPMLQDIVVIDPKQISQDAPSIIIESARSRQHLGQPVAGPLWLDGSGVVHVNESSRNLDISFTGLSFAKPEKIRFYYKLEGLDEDWTDAGAIRNAFYPYIPPGSYTFFVKAVNANGVWSDQEASISIEVAKSFWQTSWFLALVLTVVAIAIVMAYRFRVQRLRARQVRQETFSKGLMNAHESERQRIATELHDGLGQNLLIIKNLARTDTSVDIDPQEMRSNLVQISEIAAETLNETREIVGNLSPQNLRRFGLSASIGNMIEQVQKATGVRIETNIADIDETFSKESELSIFRIVQEGLNNIIKHSESPRGRILIGKTSDFVTVQLEDYGHGFDVDPILNSDGYGAGFGLRSMVQRVNLMGGEINIESVKGEGTKIVIKLVL